jgi:hypothetical protein
VRPKFAARRWKNLSDKWKTSGYYSRDPSHQQANLNLRLRRSLSWLDRAERERTDCDASFVFYWIAFNATYGQQDSPWNDPEKERALFHRYLQRAIDGDWHAVKKAIWPHLEPPITRLMNNEHVFQPFWDSQNPESSDSDWRKKFHNSKEQMNKALHQRTLVLWQSPPTGPSPMCELFNRLYTLRNQLLHGGATYRGRINRRQVEDGAQIMARLIPCFIEIMIENPETDWGLPRYPVRPDLLARRPAR